MIKKILLSILVIFVIAIITLLFWLFNDNAFPNFDKSSLIKTYNSEIQESTIPKQENDSLTECFSFILIRQLINMKLYNPDHLSVYQCKI